MILESVVNHPAQNIANFSESFTSMGPNATSPLNKSIQNIYKDSELLAKTQA